MNNCCSFVAPDDDELVRCSQLFVNLIKKQHVKIEGVTLALVVKWCLETLQLTPVQSTFQALDVIIRSHADSIHLVSFRVTINLFCGKHTS